MPETQDGFHQSAAAGIRKPVQAQQVLVQTKAIWGGHFTHADWDTGEGGCGTYGLMRSCLTILSLQMDGFFFTIHKKQKVEDK